MSKTLRESLSTVMDGEADEFEIRRVLDEIEHDDALRETWHRFHLIGSIMRDEPVPSPRLRAALKTWLDGDEVRESAPPYMVSSSDEATANKPGGLPVRLIGAVAASMFVLVTAAYLSFSEATSSPQPPAVVAASQSPAAQMPGANQSIASERPAARREPSFMRTRATATRRGAPDSRTMGRTHNAAVDGRSANQAPPGFVVRRGVVDQRRVHAYMLQHAQHTSIATRAPGMPFVKVITQKAEEEAR